MRKSLNQSQHESHHSETVCTKSIEMLNPETSTVKLTRSVRLTNTIYLNILRPYFAMNIKKYGIANCFTVVCYFINMSGRDTKSQYLSREDQTTRVYQRYYKKFPV